MPTFYEPVQSGKDNPLAHFGEEIFNPVFDDLEQGIRWMKGWQTLLSWTTLGGLAATIHIGSISALYRHLRLVGLFRTNAGLALDSIGVTFNGDSSASYFYQSRGFSTSTAIDNAVADTKMTIEDILGNFTPPADHFAPLIFDIYDYGANYKFGLWKLYAHANDAAASMRASLGSGLYRGSGALSSMTLTPISGSFIAGCQYALYGNDR